LEGIGLYGHAAVGTAKKLDGRANGAQQDNTVLGQLFGAKDPPQSPRPVAAAHPDDSIDLGVWPIMP